jgi:hypothetical protein
VQEPLDALAHDQDQVATRAQLALVGIGESALRTQLRAGRWRTLGARVVVMHNGPLTRRQEEWAGLLAAGAGAGLAGRTSLTLAGLRDWDDPAVHVLVPRGRTARSAGPVKIVVHETRLPSNGRLPTLGSPPRTPVARSAIDAASWSGNVRTACGLVAAVVQQRLSTGPRLLDALNEAGPIRHRRLLRLSLDDICGGAQALSEIDFGRLVHRNKLGTLIRQAVRLDSFGRRRYLDALIESPTGARVACEVDGALHLLASTYWKDMARVNEMVIARQALLRFPTLAMRIDEPLVVDQIRRALVALDPSQRQAS